MITLEYPDGKRILFGYIIKTKTDHLVCIIFRSMGNQKRKNKVDLKKDKQKFYKISIY